MDKARAEAEQLVAELDELRRQKAAADFAAQAGAAKSRLKSRLNAMEDAIDPVTRRRQEGYTLPRPLRTGDEVLIVDIDKKGIVLREPDAGGQVEVQAGIIKTRVPLLNLRLLDGNGKPAPKQQPKRSGERTTPSRINRSAEIEIDLRGMMTEEGILEADRFIDNAVLMGLERVTLIHGKGTGALRAAIHQHLRTHPSVKSYRLGAYGEGEAGVTIVELK